MGKRTKINKKANRKLKKLYQEKGINHCEARLNNSCCGGWALHWHHRHKRKWYYSRTEELLWSFNQTILVCPNCHRKVEHNRELNKKVFKKLRGKEKRS